MFLPLIAAEWPERIMEYPRCDLAAGFSPCLVSEAEVNTLVDSNINHVLLGVGKTFISARVRGGQRVITRDCEGEFIGPKKESHSPRDARDDSVGAG